MQGVATRRMRISTRVEERKQGWCGHIDRSGSNLHAKTTSPSDACDVEYDSRNAVVGFSPLPRRTQPSIVCKG